MEELLPGAALLATNSVTKGQAAEVRFDGVVFWCVQYHPEPALGEIADFLRHAPAPRRADAAFADG